MHVSRSTNTPQSITTNNKTYYLPSPCNVYVNSVCLHTYPSIWGSESVAFNPSRWLTLDSKVGNSQLITPERGTFLPWSFGPRACPGQRMSQVEFVTVIAILFRACKVEPVLRPAETVEQARNRLVDLTQDSQPRLSLQMNRPKDVNLRWIRR